jgi:hypothetical protein
MEQPFADRRQPHAPRRALEQLHAQLAFDPTGLLADRGLHNVQPLHCPGEAQLLGQRRSGF